MIKYTSVNERVGLRNNRNVQSPPTLDNIDNDEVEAAALQSAVRNSIRTTPGAFAVIPLDIEARNNTTAAADVPLRSAHSSADPQDGAANNSLGATGEAALSSSSYDGANSIVTDDNGNGGGGNYNGHYLPVNIDIIAEATLVPSQHEMEEEDLNIAPTEAACELVPIGGNNATPDEAPPSEMVTSTLGLADPSRQQHNANCADNTLPTAVIATAEPMGEMSAVICNRHFRLGW